MLEDKIGCLVRHARQCHLQIIAKLGRGEKRKKNRKNNGVSLKTRVGIKGLGLGLVKGFRV